MSIAQSLMMEFEQEGKTTRKLLEAIPEGSLSYKPHEKSMSMVQLANHIATAPGFLAQALVPDVFEMPDPGPQPDPTTKAEILANFDAAQATVKETMAKFDDAAMMGTWTFKYKGATIMSIPRVAAAKTLVGNHTYHHRGQLSVYVRLAGGKVPSIYGPSADDNPFG